MNSFPASDLLINACRLLLTFSVGSGIPLVMLPGRDALYRLYWISGMAQWCSRSNKPDVEVANPLNNSSIEMGLPTIKSTSSRVGSSRAVHKASFSGDGAGGAATVPVRGPRSQADVLADALAQAQARADQIDAEQRRKQRMKRKSLHVSTHAIWRLQTCWLTLIRARAGYTMLSRACRLTKRCWPVVDVVMMGQTSHHCKACSMKTPLGWFTSM